MLHYLTDNGPASPTRMTKHSAMATLTLASSDPAEVRLGPAVEIPVAVDLVKGIRVDAVAEMPVADPPPAPHVDVDNAERRDHKAEAKSTAHILRHMPFNNPALLKCQNLTLTRLSVKIKVWCQISRNFLNFKICFQK